MTWLKDRPHRNKHKIPQVHSRPSNLLIGEEADYKLPITAFIITFNEEKNIKDCLQSLQFCQEVIVVDSGSTDRTCQIAKENGAKVIFNEFKNYTTQKQYALDQCTNDWVLSLDADERVSKKLYEFLASKSFLNEKYSGFQVRILHWFWGTWIKHSGLYPNYKLRFFRKSEGKYTGQGIHETVSLKTGSKIKTTNCDLLHYAWNASLGQVNGGEFSRFISKQMHYYQKVAYNKFLAARHVSYLGAIFRGIYTFLYRYFLRLGFLDGVAGAVVSYGSAYLTTFKYLHLLELNHRFSQTPSWRQHCLGKIVLFPFKLMYALAAGARVLLYKTKIIKTQELSLPVISVGNLSVGGSGKTPFVIWLCNQLSSVVGNIAILSRGYKSKTKIVEPIVVNHSSSPEEIGDEALVLHRALQSQNAKVIVCPSRYEAGELAVKLNAELCVLDDGFQHIQLARDFNICLLDCSDKAALSLLPSGNAREGFNQLSRADAVILTRTEINELLLKKFIKQVQKNFSKPIYILKEEIQSFAYGHDSVQEFLENKRVFAFSGIGNSLQFYLQLQHAKLLIQGCKSYVDHHEYTLRDLEYLENQRLSAEAEFLVTTAKDMVKIHELNPEFASKVLVAKQKIIGLFRLEDGTPTEIKDLLGFDLFARLLSKEAKEIG
jgi:tetraacyldisaccharide 4'-kinase